MTRQASVVPLSPYAGVVPLLGPERSHPMGGADAHLMPARKLHLHHSGLVHVPEELMRVGAVGAGHVYSLQEHGLGRKSCQITVSHKL